MKKQKPKTKKQINKAYRKAESIVNKIEKEVIKAMTKSLEAEVEIWLNEHQIDLAQPEHWTETKDCKVWQQCVKDYIDDTGKPWRQAWFVGYDGKPEWTKCIKKTNLVVGTKPKNIIEEKDGNKYATSIDEDTKQKS